MFVHTGIPDLVSILFWRFVRVIASIPVGAFSVVFVTAALIFELRVKITRLLLSIRDPCTMVS